MYIFLWTNFYLPRIYFRCKEEIDRFDHIEFFIMYSYHTQNKSKKSKLTNHAIILNGYSRSTYLFTKYHQKYEKSIHFFSKVTHNVTPIIYFSKIHKRWYTVPQSISRHNKSINNSIHQIYKGRTITNPFSTKYVKTSHNFSKLSTNNLIHYNVSSSNPIQDIFNQNPVSTQFHTYNSPPTTSFTYSHNTLSGGILSGNKAAKKSLLPSNCEEMNNENSFPKKKLLLHLLKLHIVLSKLLANKANMLEKKYPSIKLMRKKRSQLKKLRNV